MIKFENTSIVGWEPAIRGMRNPLNSWDKSDSWFCQRSDCPDCDLADNCRVNDLDFTIGENDYDLMMRLVKSGNEHAKFRRMIVVYVDITAPLYWWKEFDTYKVGTVANSCSTMHTIHKKRFEKEDFSLEHFQQASLLNKAHGMLSIYEVIDSLNHARAKYLETKDKNYWYQMIQLLPSSYNQKRTVMLNYEVLANIYHQRQNHKLDEWKEFCLTFVENLPYSELITGQTQTMEQN